MDRKRILASSLLLATFLATSVDAGAQTKPAGKPAARTAAAAAAQLEPRAMDLLHAMSSALTGASRCPSPPWSPTRARAASGPALAYSTTSDVLLQRPDKLRVVTLGDGPAAEY